MLSRSTKILLFLLACIPWLMQLPYLIHAWRYSPPDRWDWGWLVLAAGLALGGQLFVRRWCGKGNGWFAIPALIGLAGYGCGLGSTTHALALGGAIILSWGVAGMLWGDALAMAVLPLVGLMMLSTPGTNYWFGVLLSCDGWIPNGALGAICGGWFAVSWRRRQLPRWRYLVFGAGLLLLAGLYGWPSGKERVYPAFLPVIEDFQPGRWVGREIAPDENDRHFFGKSRVRRHFFADDQRSISLLKVDRFENIHKIHPAGYCLKAAGHSVVRDRLRTIRLPDGDLQLNEILTDAGDGKFTLVWAWYSNPENSSGDFLFFRRHYRPDSDWSAWQLGTAGRHGEESAAAEALTRMLSAWQSGKKSR